MSESASRQAQAGATASRSRAQPRRKAEPAVGGEMGGEMAAVQALGTRSGNRAVSGLATGGVPLPAEVLQDMETRFGESFGQVRIHDSPQAHASAAALHAKAYTRGQDIVFGLHRYAPRTSLGKRLLAHELAHVVQQRRGGAAPVLDAQASHEQAADAAANAVAAGQAQVAVAGATGVGVARDEDDSWSSRLRRKYREIKDKIPPEYRDKMQQAADYAADKAVSTAALPFGPAAAYASDGLGSSLLHGAQKAVSGEEGAADDLKKFGRDKAQEALGAAKGVATQATEVADTAMWVGNEYKELRDKAAEKIGGPPGSAGHTLVKESLDATARAIPGMAALPDLGKASDEAKKHGLVDTETGQASITAPMSVKLNEWAKSAETELGVAPRGEEMFTPMEKAEIASSLATQAALAATGVEEVKVAMNAIGALGSVRAIVEMIRHDLGWRTSPRFIGHLVGLGLSLVGLKHSMAASKFTTIALRYGSLAAAFPVLAQLAADYYTLNTSPDMPPLERKKLEASIKQDWIAVIHIVKDAILHIAQSQAGKPKPGQEPPEGPPAAGAAKAAPGAEEGGAKPAASTAPVEAAPAPTPTATPAPQPATPAPAAVPAAAPPAPPMAAQAPEATPITGAQGKPASPATRSLQANLARQAPGQAGSVSRLRPRKGAGTPPSEPASQLQPAVVEVPEPMAVGQTHGPGTAPAGKPRLGVIPGGKQAPVASLKPPPAKPAPIAVSPAAPPMAKGVPAKPAGAAGAKPPSAPKPAAPARTRSAHASEIESRLQALKVPPDQRGAFKAAAKAVREAAKKDPQAANRLLEGLEDRFGAKAAPSPVQEEFGAAQKQLFPEKGPDNKYRQSTAADERAQLEQARPGAKAARKAKVRESERMGVAGGQAQAAKEGITVKDWNTPQQWKGEFGKGPDALGSRGRKRQFLEFKGGGSALGKSKGVTEMSNEWAGRKIAELEAVGDRATAAQLLQAAREGNLQGVVYRTRQLASGESTTRLKGHQLRDHLPGENISASGLIEYSPTKVERAYQQRKQELQKALASGNLRGLRNL